MSRVARSALCALALVATAVPASAEDVLKTARENFEQAWDACPFSLANVVLVAGPTEGYGIYEPRQDNVFQADEPIHIYLEPVCYGYMPSGERFTFGMTADFLIMDQNGNVLGGQRNFAEFDFESFRRNKELKIDVNYELTGAPPGVYTIETTLHDKGGKGSASGRVEVEFQ